MFEVYDFVFCGFIGFFIFIIIVKLELEFDDNNRVIFLRVLDF